MRTISCSRACLLVRSKRGRSPRSSLLASLFLALAHIVVGCSKEPVDTPEQAFSKVKAACQDRDWARLFDTFPPDTQGYFGAQIAGYVMGVKARAKVTAETEQIDEGLVVQRLLSEEMKVTLPQWEKMVIRDRFAVWFEAAGGSSAIASTGFQPELVARSEIRRVETLGTTAKVIVSDDQGHVQQLSLILVDRIWRLDLGYE